MGAPPTATGPRTLCGPVWTPQSQGAWIQRGAQRASRVVLGTSGLHARGEGERVLALESREGTRPGSKKGKEHGRAHADQAVGRTRRSLTLWCPHRPTQGPGPCCCGRGPHEWPPECRMCWAGLSLCPQPGPACGSSGSFLLPLVSCCWRTGPAAVDAGSWRRLPTAPFRVVLQSLTAWPCRWLCRWDSPEAPQMMEQELLLETLALSW